jgi:hypothetical protein
MITQSMLAQCYGKTLDQVRAMQDKVPLQWVSYAPQWHQIMVSKVKMMKLGERIYVPDAMPLPPTFIDGLNQFDGCLYYVCSDMMRVHATFNKHCSFSVCEGGAIVRIDGRQVGVKSTLDGAYLYECIINILARAMEGNIVSQILASTNKSMYSPTSFVFPGQVGQGSVRLLVRVDHSITVETFHYSDLLTVENMQLYALSEADLNFLRMMFRTQNLGLVIRCDSNPVEFAETIDSDDPSLPLIALYAKDAKSVSTCLRGIRQTASRLKLVFGAPTLIDGSVHVAINPNVLRRLILDHIGNGAGYWILDIEQTKGNTGLAHATVVSDWAALHSSGTLLWGKTEQSFKDTIVKFDDPIFVKGAYLEQTVLHRSGYKWCTPMHNGMRMMGVWDLTPLLMNTWTDEGNAYTSHEAARGVYQKAHLLRGVLLGRLGDPALIYNVSWMLPVCPIKIDRPSAINVHSAYVISHGCENLRSTTQKKDLTPVVQRFEDAFPEVMFSHPLIQIMIQWCQITKKDLPMSLLGHPHFTMKQIRKAASVFPRIEKIVMPEMSDFKNAAFTAVVRALSDVQEVPMQFVTTGIPEEEDFDPNHLALLAQERGAGIRYRMLTRDPWFGVFNLYHTHMKCAERIEEDINVYEVLDEGVLHGVPHSRRYKLQLGGLPHVPAWHFPVRSRKTEDDRGPGTIPQIVRVIKYWAKAMSLKSHDEQAREVARLAGLKW